MYTCDQLRKLVAKERPVGMSLSPDLAFPIDVGLLKSYFYKAYYYYEVIFITKLKEQLI